MSDNIKVVVKVRPLILREIEAELRCQWRVRNNTLYQLDQNGKDFGVSYTFDQVYDKDTETSNVYNDVAKPIVQAATEGFNGTIFAYGQTSSGKTYTMTGTDSVPGIIPLAVINLFEIIKKVPDRDFLVRVSYIEIYNESLRDLLNMEKENVRIHESLQGIKVDVTERVTSSPEDVLKAMKEGEANRQKGATNMNELSSRSHSIFQIIIESRQHTESEEEAGIANVSILNLVDLAGSERSGQTGAKGIRFKEGTHINKSLSVLALVIKQLSEDQKFINYRDSKLTRILQNSLGGNAKTSIICAVTPAAVEETISTLQFANRAKAIKNKPEVNEVATEKTMIRKLTKQMSLLQAQLESKKNLEDDNMNLQKQITNLQKFILNGFNQRRSIDIISGARKKLQQPRRMTISTVHSIEEDPVLTVPKFCTPSLKYNPMSIPTPIIKPQIERLSKLDSVPEEPLKPITPPPQRLVQFSNNNEIIDLDSDDDSTQDLPTCSPIHKCHDASKTPPCILRRNAKLAEKNYKDIVELTEREKIYTPNVVELIDKLDHNTTVIAQLKDEIETLSKQGQYKDLQMCQLKKKIDKAESDMAAIISENAELKTQCTKINVQLTDSEVSYETLLKKAKLREEELISLLEEQKTIKSRNIDCKSLPRPIDKEINFMDMSKDISLVNSDNENSIVFPNEQVNKVLVETQTQLCVKSQSVIDLETDVFNHKQTIAKLENCINDLQGKVNSFNETLRNMETENSLLKSNIDTLNTTISNQKTTLEKAHSDIVSYNSVIQELHIQLSQKDNLPKVNINDSVIENMIATEEKFIANNDNMRNIIYCLKNALDIRNKEIEKLKTTLKDNDDINLENKELVKQLEIKSMECNEFNSKVIDLNESIYVHIATIDKLMGENNNLKISEQELSKNNASLVEKLSGTEEHNFKMEVAVKEYETKITELLSVNNELVEQIDELTTKTTTAEVKLKEQNDLLSQLLENEKECKEGLLKAKAAVVKLQSILGTISGNMQAVPEIIDSFVKVFNILSIGLDNLENVTNEIVMQRDQAIETNNLLKTQLEDQINKYNVDVSRLQEQLNELKSNNDCIKDKDQEVLSLLAKNYDYENLVLEKENVIVHLTKQVENLIKEKETNQELYEQMLNVKENTSAELAQKISEFENHKHANENLILLKEKTISGLTKKLEALENLMQEKDCHYNKINEEMLQSFIGIITRVISITNSLEIPHKLNNSSDNIEKNYDQILITLDNIERHLSSFALKNDNSVDKTKPESREVTEQNVDVERLLQIELQNKELKFALDNIENENRTYKEDMLHSERILKSLQGELKTKVSEIAHMENQVKDWKEQFTNLNFVMDERISDLQLENEDLKAHVKYLKRRLRHSACDFDGFNSNTILNTDITQTNFNCNVSPPSLITICCNKISDYIQPKAIDSRTTTIDSNENITCNMMVQTKANDSTTISIDSNVDVAKDDRSLVILCKCKELYSELETVREENNKITSLLEQMEVINLNLIEEQEAVRNELRLLVAPANELQKKIANHKTNLSILTATTFAENRLLQSQVKVLQHYNQRFLNVFQKDIPNYKQQLLELMSLLKGDYQLADFKRYSLPNVLDSSTAVCNFKNESTLDSDLLMLDTNVTLATTADYTLTGNDQTCLDITQLYNEAACQTNDLNQTAQQVETLGGINQSVYEKLNKLEEENINLRELVNKIDTKDTQNSSTQIDLTRNLQKPVPNVSSVECAKCLVLAELEHTHNKLKEEIKLLVKELTDTKCQKTDIEQKYTNLTLETPSTDALIHKLGKLEKEYNNKTQEAVKLNNILIAKTKELNTLQEENDTLSNQVMENISEVDKLNEELTNLKQDYNKLLEKYNESEQSIKEPNKETNKDCLECLAKDEVIKKLDVLKTHSKLNRSLSDSDTSSRHNKISTLQNELHKGREDCRELTEDVVTIKNHLNCGDIPMDLDTSMDDPKENAIPQTYGMPEIPEESCTDVYTFDKTECLKFFLGKTDSDENTLSRNVKIIDVMKMLYDYLITKHGNQVENLSNKLKDITASKCDLETQLSNLYTKYSDTIKDLELKNKSRNENNSLSQIKYNLTKLKEIINSSSNFMGIVDLINLYKDKFLNLVDSELDISSGNIFESIVKVICNKHEEELTDIKNKFTELQKHMNNATIELNYLNGNIETIKSQLSAKETEYNLLKAQNENIHEINKTVTLDIVQKEKDLKRTIAEGYKKLVELNVLNIENLNMDASCHDNINYLIEKLINQHKELNLDKESLVKEVSSLTQIAEDKSKELDLIKQQHDKLEVVNSSIVLDLNTKINKLETLESQHKDLNRIYEDKLKESDSKSDIIAQLTEEINLLKTNITTKEDTIKQLRGELTQNNNDEKVKELIETIQQLNHEIVNLKAINEVITKENDSYAFELKQSGETIKKNNIDLDKMTSDILVLRESVKENSSVIDNLNAEAKSLLYQNKELKEQLEESQKSCNRLEMNIKIHENTAKVQSRMIMRLQNQKAEDDNTIRDKVKQLEELNQQYLELEKENKKLGEDLEDLRKIKSALESRISEIDAENIRQRFSIDISNDALRRRRQSLHDSKRMFAEDKHEYADHSQMEAVFDSRSKPDDLFMDVDEDESNRSTPIRLSKGRQSISLSRTDPSEDEDSTSRPSSVQAARRRRQSVHDLQRTVLRHTPSPHGTSIREIEELKPTDTSAGSESELLHLKKLLDTCQLELEDLKEKYRELDDECETCAEYLRERDEQCSRLKKEKAALQVTIAELKEKLLCNNNSEQNTPKPVVAHVAINTDEDWTNLHSVVVDRMSFDAEVEKNKKLTKTIEELRFKKQDLKNTLSKMQKALERHTGNKELEATKSELQSCKQELVQLREKYKELDEECETCSQYLREKEAQCRRLIEAKTALEAKLEEFQGDGATKAHSTRKKRQSLHDQNRTPGADLMDATTETSDDFLSYQVERDGGNKHLSEETQAKERRYKAMIEKLTQQKAVLEQQLISVSAVQVPAMYVATGSAIVQNQQLTDVMKENQKLKKINSKLIHMCKKRGKESNRENEDPAEQMGKN